MNNYNESKQAVIVTPTTGNVKLKEAIESVKNQNYSNIIHLLVIDGFEYNESVNEILKEINVNNVKVIVLPFNTGKNGFNGHRIYAASAFLIDADYIFFLDEDNTFDDNHVESLIQLMEAKDLDWAYSFRKIYTYHNVFITNDDCENLGIWPTFSGHPNLVDTSCYAFKRHVLLNIGHIWHHKLGADRTFFKKAREIFPKFSTTSLYTLNYRLHKYRLPKEEYFINGNKIMLDFYNQILPWKQK